MFVKINFLHTACIWVITATIHNALYKYMYGIVDEYSKW